MSDDKHLTDVRFDSFDFTPEILAGIKDAGFEYCTPIQAESLKPALSGQDIAGQAQTGTGKTAAFLLAALQYMENHPATEQRKPNQPRVLIVAPTRELAIQIYKDALVFAGHTGHKIEVVYGGTGYDKQRDAVRKGADILIGTPGRLIDYFKQQVYNLRATQVVILDEADRMFDLGFIKDIRFLLHRCPAPEKRLGMLFSATLSLRVSELAYEHMNNPQSIKIATEKVTADKITQVGYMTANEEKIPLLLGLLKSMQNARSIVFVNTKRAADEVWGFLQGNGIETAVLSGDVPQKKREQLLEKFKTGVIDVLVATDVAARGLHIPAVSHVINYDLPEDAEDYVHRIGRTGRAGAKGDAISFACETYSFSLPDIEAFTGIKIPMQAISQDLMVEIDPKSRIRTHRKKPHPRRNQSGNRNNNRNHQSRPRRS